MSTPEIAEKAAFDHIRYAQLWEDADVLTTALGNQSGRRLVSICSAGDNALALLTLDPTQVFACDISAAQLGCLRLRMNAYQRLTHTEFLELMGSRPSRRREDLLDAVLEGMDERHAQQWSSLRTAVIAYGLGGVGRFERYFRIFRTYLLPLVHSRTTILDTFRRRTKTEREHFLEKRFNTWRWHSLVNVFFSNTVMGWLGRDRAFFDHVKGSLADHVHARVFHAGVTTSPADNPYLHWILTGTHGEALPLAWRAEHFEAIRTRLDRLVLHQGPVEDFSEQALKADGFNLSDIFEYMTPQATEAVYGRLLAQANPKARLVYWNMMVPRRVPQCHASRVTRLQDLEDALKLRDHAFFYSDFVVEEVRP